MVMMAKVTVLWEEGMENQWQEEGKVQWALCSLHRRWVEGSYLSSRSAEVSQEYQCSSWRLSPSGGKLLRNWWRRLKKGVSGFGSEETPGSGKRMSEPAAGSDRKLPDSHVLKDLSIPCEAKQGMFICRAHFVYKTVQGALHKILEALKKRWSTLKTQKNKLN